MDLNFSKSDIDNLLPYEFEIYKALIDRKIEKERKQQLE